MSIAFFWCYIKIGNVLFKNLMGATLVPLSIFLFNVNFALWDENTIKDRITILYFHKGFLRSRNKIMMLFYCFKVNDTYQGHFKGRKG